MIKGEFDIDDYKVWLKALKQKIVTSRSKIAFSINSALLELYWDIGKDICYKQKHSSWGSKITDQIALDLKQEFPDIKGFSRRNIYAMKQWYLFYSEISPFVPQLVAQIPWGHNRLIVSKVKNVNEAFFYTQEALSNTWSRSRLEIEISENLYFRKGKSHNNFETTLSQNQSKIATNIFKDPYNFDFLGLENDALEKSIENELTKHITKFLLELGKGFAFVGSQFKIEVSERDYFIDLLFYHLDLRCYVVIELKSGRFKPEFAGKLNFYLSAVDSSLKKTSDNPTIGILLCKQKDSVEVEYTLRDIKKPLGISEYRLTELIPDKLKAQLPSIEELENNIIEKIKIDNN